MRRNFAPNLHSQQNNLCLPINSELRMNLTMNVYTDSMYFYVFFCTDHCFWPKDFGKANSKMGFTSYANNLLG